MKVAPHGSTHTAEVALTAVACKATFTAYVPRGASPILVMTATLKKQIAPLKKLVVKI